MRYFSLLLVLFASAAVAGDDYYPPVKEPKVLAECGSCHLAYPPQLAPAGVWKSIMANLGKHFGDDASLPAAEAAEIERFLVANAGRERRKEWINVQAISDQRWFRKEHREVADRVGRGRPVASFAQCESCHTRAAEGYFDDDDGLKVPR